MKTKNILRKKISFEPIIFILSLFFTVLNSYSETNPKVSLSKSMAYTYSGCPAKDVTITNFFIRKLDVTHILRNSLLVLFKK
jgi:hypothetical protein